MYSIDFCLARIEDRLKVELTKLSLFHPHKFAQYNIIVLFLAMFSTWQRKIIH